jgi:hypothetical protein
LGAGKQNETFRGLGGKIMKPGYHLEDGLGLFVLGVNLCGFHVGLYILWLVPSYHLVKELQSFLEPVCFHAQMRGLKAPPC